MKKVYPYRSSKGGYSFYAGDLVKEFHCGTIAVTPRKQEETMENKSGEKLLAIFEYLVLQETPLWLLDIAKGLNINA